MFICISCNPKTNKQTNNTSYNEYIGLQTHLPLYTLYTLYGICVLYTTLKQKFIIHHDCIPIAL